MFAKGDRVTSLQEINALSQVIVFIDLIQMSASLSLWCQLFI